MSKGSSVRSKRRRLWFSLIASVVVTLGSFGATLAMGWTPKLGLDLAGGLSVVYRPDHKISAADLNQTVAILSNRVDGLGVSGAQVSTQGTDIVVSVPGAKNSRQILKSIGQTAQLFFRPVLCYAPGQFKATKKVKIAPKGTPLPECAAASQLSAANMAIAPNSSAAGYSSANVSPDYSLGSYQSTPSAMDIPTQKVLLPGLTGEAAGRYLLGPSQLSGTAVKTAYAQQGQTGEWVVNYKLTAAGSPAWDKVAQDNFHQLVAIELDGVVQSAPIIQPTDAAFTSFGGTGQISGGGMTQAQAQKLAMAMQFGALPVRLQPLTVQTISPSLGKSSLTAGLGAGIAGLLLVLLYVLLYYRGLGLVIVAGLGLTAAFLWAVISGLGHTAAAPSFDLAGVTGLIVSIGITVDSYIVYFERLKDEARTGRSIRSSVDRSFHSAWRTVLAADLVSLIAAVLLYFLALGAVRGFAFFLGLSTLLDIAMTWTFTRPAVMLLGQSDRSGQAGFLGLEDVNQPSEVLA
ncbi:MAG: protein translocase subunit SecD [Actinomycetota bacterium]